MCKKIKKLKYFLNYTTDNRQQTTDNEFIYSLADTMRNCDVYDG